MMLKCVELVWWISFGSSHTIARLLLSSHLANRNKIVRKSKFTCICALVFDFAVFCQRFKSSQMKHNLNSLCCAFAVEMKFAAAALFLCFGLANATIYLQESFTDGGALFSGCACFALFCIPMGLLFIVVFSQMAGRRVGLSQTGKRTLGQKKNRQATSS